MAKKFKRVIVGYTSETYIRRDEKDGIYGNIMYSPGYDIAIFDKKYRKDSIKVKVTIEEVGK